MKASELEEQIRAAFPREEELQPSTPNSPNGGLINPIQVAPLADSWNWNRIGLSAAALLAVLGAGAAVFRIWQEAPGLIESARNEARQSAEPDATIRTSASQPTAEVRIAQSAPSEGTKTASGEPATSETTITISGGGMAVRLVAEQDTWVSMTANGSHVFSELLKANQSRTISGVENARMVIGNAGGVKIATDGKDIGPIGLPGQVRVVMLSPEGPKIGTMPAI